MSKKTRNWLIALGVFVVIGLIGMISGGRDKPAEVRIVSAETAVPAETAEPSAKPTATPKPTVAPTPAPAASPDPEPTPVLQTLEPVLTDDPAPDRSAPAADPTPTPVQERDYVLNTNTMKFHVTSCSSVKDIKDSNRKDVHATRDSIIAQGYAPCGRCKP